MDPITSAISAVSSTVGSIVTRIWPDKTEVQKAQLAAELERELTREDHAFQLSLAQINASAGASFRGGAGWVSVVGLAFIILKSPIEWGFKIAGHPVDLPTVDSTVIFALLGNLLGLSGWHTWENVKGK